MELHTFKDDCSPQKNVVFKRLQYWSHQRTAGTSVDTFITELRHKSKECEFGLSENDMLRDKLVFSITDCHLKERLLQERGLTLHRAIEICRTTEQEKTPLQAMETEHGIQQVPVDGEMILPDKNLHHNTRKHLGFQSVPNMDQSVKLVVAAFMPNIQLHRLQLQQPSVTDCFFSERKNVEQLLPEHLHIKEEPEMLSEGQEGNQLYRHQETNTAVSPVKWEDEEEEPQASQLHWRQQTQINIKEETSRCTLDELKKRQSVGINNKEPAAARNPDLSSLDLQGPDGTETDSSLTEDSNTYDDDDDSWQKPVSDSTKVTDSNTNVKIEHKAAKTQICSNKKDLNEIRSESVNSSTAYLGGEKATPNEDSKEAGQAKAKPYRCDVCRKCFKLKFILNQHLKVHIGESDARVGITSKEPEAAEKPDLSSLVLQGPDGTETNLTLTKDRNTYDDNHGDCYGWQKPLSDTEAETNDFDTMRKKRKKFDSSKHAEIGHKSAKTQISPFQEICPNKTVQMKATSDSTKNSTACLTLNEDLNITVHTGNKPFRCDFCNRYFCRFGHLQSHMRIHTGEKPFQCKICRKQFKQKSNLIYHIRIHAGEKPFQCDVCNKCFTHKIVLNNHKKIHTGEKPFQCDVCSKCFNQKGNLKKHVRLHTGETPFKCDVCSKGFNQNGNLKKHMRVHAGEKPFEWVF